MSGRDDMYFPPPPPPVMPVLLNSIPPINPISACGFITVPVSVIPCGFQHPEQELFEATRLLWERERSEYPPEVICYNHIQPILQDGPKCGLVALSMASTLTRQPLSVEQLFWKAVNRGFSHHGEMFSVDNMAALAAETLQDSCQQVEVLNRGLGHDMTYILGHLAHGAILLVPYDADANHAPCLRRGHKAHWAAVCGAVRLDSSAVYVVARQGKSRRLALWSYEELRLSNENLIELDPIRAADGRGYVLPHGGVAAGLRGRAILLHGLN